MAEEVRKYSQTKLHEEFISAHHATAPCPWFTSPASARADETVHLAEHAIATSGSRVASSGRDEAPLAAAAVDAECCAGPVPPQPLVVASLLRRADFRGDFAAGFLAVGPAKLEEELEDVEVDGFLRFLGFAARAPPPLTPLVSPSVSWTTANVDRASTRSGAMGHRSWGSPGW